VSFSYILVVEKQKTDGMNRSFEERFLRCLFEMGGYIGYVAQISGELEESLPGWQVLVGPQEASDLGSYIKLQAG
jgi:hypothetical protein